jgi:hypothetical protein
VTVWLPVRPLGFRKPTNRRTHGDQSATLAVARQQPGLPNAARRQFDFTDDRYEWRRLFSELFGTFLLVLAAAGGRW